MKKIFFLIALIILPGYSFAYSDTQNHWAYEYINNLTESSIVSGYPDGTFRPDSNVTRAEFMTMLTKTLGLEYENLEEHWAKGFANVLHSKQIIDDINNLDNNITRKEVMEMLVRSGKNSSIVYKTKNSNKFLFYDIAGESRQTKNIITILWESKIVNGYADKTLRINNNLTRAEACTFICNFIANREKLDNYSLKNTDIYYDYSRFINLEELPYELSKWQYADMDEYLVTTTLHEINMFKFSEDYDGKYKDVFSEFYTVKHRYFEHRKKVGDNKYVIALEFETQNNSDYQTIAGCSQIIMLFPEEDIEILDSFDLEEIAMQRQDRSHLGVKLYPGEKTKTTAFFVVDKLPEKLIEISRFVDTMYDTENKMIVDVKSHNSLVIGNLK